MTSLDSIIAELERLADGWRWQAMRLDGPESDHLRVCANDLLRVTRAIRAESIRPENAGGPPPSPLSVTGRASSADDARPSSMP